LTPMPFFPIEENWSALVQQFSSPRARIGILQRNVQQVQNFTATFSSYAPGCRRQLF
jgi:hypothetical protein